MAQDITSSIDRTGLTGADPTVDKADMLNAVNDLITVINSILNGGQSFDKINFEAATELTIATGAVTATQTLHTVDTQADASTDDLDTITGSAGDVLYLRAADTDRTVVIKHGTGNITTFSGTDVSLDDTNKTAHLVRFSTTWYVLSATGGSTTTGFAKVVEGRLSLSASDPAPIADQTAAATLYFLPYGGNQIALYDGADWALHTIPDAGISIAIPATTNTNYDVFAYDVLGTKTLELIAWTNDTTRATALTTQNGVYVLTGLPARRYVGTIRTTGTTGECEDSQANRLVWNYYNRKRRAMLVLEATNSWSYTSATLRPLNNSTTNRLAFVNGVQEEAVTAIATVNARTTSGADFSVGIGLDSTTAISALTVGGKGGINGTGTEFPAAAHFEGDPGVGYHYLQALESGSTGVTLVGDDGGTLHVSGIKGAIAA